MYKQLTVKNSNVIIWRDDKPRDYKPTYQSWNRIERLLDSGKLEFITSVLGSTGLDENAFCFEWIGDKNADS